MMARLAVIWITLILFSVSEVRGLSGNFFNCLREGNPCFASCSADGTECLCNTQDQHPSTNFQHLCKSPATNYSCGADDPCKNGGLCYVSGSPSCICPSSFYGSNCEKARFVVSCTMDVMKVDFVPYDFENNQNAFQGRVFPSDHDTTECQFTRGTTYTREFRLGTNCGMTFSIELDGTVRFDVNVVVLYSSGTPVMMTNTDQLLTATCRFPPNATATSFNIVDVLSRGMQNATGLVVDSLSLSIRDGYQADKAYTLSDTVNVGRLLRIQTDFTANQAFQDYAIESCIASNGANPNSQEYASLDIIKDGCLSGTAVNAGGPVNVSTTEGDTFKKAISVPIKAVLFVSGSKRYVNQMYVQCVIAMCNEDNLGACASTYPNCEPARRQKRAAGEPPVTATVKGSVNVGYNQSEVQNSSTQQTSTENPSDRLEVCMQQPQAQNIVILLGVLLLVVLVAAITLAVLFCRGRRRRSKKGEKLRATDGSFNPAFANSSAYDLTTRAR